MGLAEGPRLKPRPRNRLSSKTPDADVAVVGSVRQVASVGREGHAMNALYGKLELSDQPAAAQREDFNDMIGSNGQGVERLRQGYSIATGGAELRAANLAPASCGPHPQ